MFQDINSDTLSSIANPVSVYEIVTLCDITDSGIITPKRDQTGFYQAQNLNTFLQVLGLRTQVLEYSVSITTADFFDYKFTQLGAGKIWILQVVPESTDPWTRDGDPLYWLMNDFMGVPVHTDLTESVKIKPEIVNTLPGRMGEINTRFNITLKA
jgi:hypothetical protein